MSTTNKLYTEEADLAEDEDAFEHVIFSLAQDIFIRHIASNRLYDPDEVSQVAQYSLNAAGLFIFSFSEWQAKERVN